MGFLCLPVWVWGAALQPLGPPELFYELYSQQSTEEIFDNMGTMSVPSRILCLTFKVLQMGVFGFFYRKELEPRVLQWQRNYGCYFLIFLIMENNELNLEY